MVSLLAELSPGMFFQVVVFVSLCAIFIASIVGFWFYVIKHRNEVSLKQSMVDQGMSAEEIEKVIKAKL
jgi:hypothetical protein